MKKAIIFDLYGTLIKINKKTNPYLYLLSKSDYFYRNKIGLSIITDNYTTEELISNNNLSVDKHYFNSLIRTEIDSVAPLPGVYGCLSKLSEKYRLFLLSNLSVPYKEPYYSLDFDAYFERAFFSCDEHDKKPNYSFFEKILTYSKLEKEEIIMIGDSILSDVEGAKNFGIDYIHIKKNDKLEDLIKYLY